MKTIDPSDWDGKDPYELFPEIRSLDRRSSARRRKTFAEPIKKDDGVAQTPTKENKGCDQ